MQQYRRYRRQPSELPKPEGFVRDRDGLDALLSVIPKSIVLKALSAFQESFMFEPRPYGLRPIKPPREYGLANMRSYHVKSKASNDSDRDVKIGLWVQPPVDDTKPIYLVFAGNSGHWGDRGWRDPEYGPYDRQYRIKLLKAISDRGAGIVAVHLRGYGLSERSGTPSEEGFRLDVDAALDAMLKKANIPSHRIIVLGESMGAAVAAIAVEQMTNMGMPPAVLGMVAGFSSMDERAHDERDQFTQEEMTAHLRHHFPTKDIIQKVDPRTTVCLGHDFGYRWDGHKWRHGDETTSGEHSKRNYASAMEVSERQMNGNVHLVPLAGGHVGWSAEDFVDYTMRKYDEYARQHAGLVR